MKTRFTLVASALVAVVAITAGGAFAHARVSPPVALAKQSQLFSLVVPTEKESLTTSKVVLTLPAGFSIDSFVAAPGWTRTVQQTGTGDSAVIQKVTWSGGSTPTGEDSLFQFLGLASAAKTYAFGVQQTYSDGSIVDWNGPESSDTPTATIEAKSSFGGGGSSMLAIVALVVGAIGLVIGGVALVSRGGGRPMV